MPVQEKPFIFLNGFFFSHRLVVAKRILPEIFKNMTFDVLWEGEILFQYIYSQII